MRDVREQLFDAAERVLLRDGPNGLTSRAVTAEAGCAKGVLHKHFADFDAFLLDLILDRVARIGRQAEALRAAAGTGTVVGNLTAALHELFGSIGMAMVSLLIARDELRRRVRQARMSGLPVLSEASAMITSYLEAERNLGRVPAGADLGTVAPMLVGVGHLAYAELDAAGPTEDAVRKMVAAALAGASAPLPGPSTVDDSYLRSEAG
jgi:AcrR family transcriptional regulator